MCEYSVYFQLCYNNVHKQIKDAYKGLNIILYEVVEQKYWLL